LEGMRDNLAAAKELGVTYWPFVETPEDAGRGLVRTLCEGAAARNGPGPGFVPVR